MCGIVGIFDPQSSLENQQNKIRNCLSISNHRGPDENGIFSNQKNHFTFGMNRLSILDLQSGQQPLFLKMEDIVLFLMEKLLILKN